MANPGFLEFFLPESSIFVFLKSFTGRYHLHRKQRYGELPSIPSLMILLSDSLLREDKSGSEVGFFLFGVDKGKVPRLSLLGFMGTDRQAAALAS